MDIRSRAFPCVPVRVENVEQEEEEEVPLPLHAYLRVYSCQPSKSMRNALSRADIPLLSRTQCLAPPAPPPVAWFYSQASHTIAKAIAASSLRRKQQTGLSIGGDKCLPRDCYPRTILHFESRYSKPGQTDARLSRSEG